jgi:hypothetical protein
MRPKVIIACSQIDLLELLLESASIAVSKLDPEMEPFICTSVRELELIRKRKRSSEIELLIIHAGLLENPSAGQTAEKMGLEFILSLKQETQPPQCIAVCEDIDRNDAITLQSLGYARTLLIDMRTDYTGFFETIIRSMRMIDITVPEIGDPSRGKTAKCKDPDKTPFALLDLDIPKNSKETTITLSIFNSSNNQSFQVPAKINPRYLRDFVSKSRALRDRISQALIDPEDWRNYVYHWHEEYRSIGQLAFEIMSTKEFDDLLQRARTSVGSNYVRIRFSLHQDHFDGLWEAVFNQNSSRYFIEENIITRRISSFYNESANQIDADDGTLNILAIAADVGPDASVSGPNDAMWDNYWSMYGGQFTSLKMINDEMNIISSLHSSLTGQPGKHSSNINVRVLQGQVGGTSWSMAREVKNILRNARDNKYSQSSLSAQRFDVVHFAGHALFSPEGSRGDRRGYVIFPGNPVAEAIPIAEFAHWLADAGVQLVYLSCCRSGAGEAALELARNNVPMTIGFNWDLEEKLAVHVASIFYDELIGSDLKVCQAFDRARRSLRAKFSYGDPIWASPVLFAQSSDWSKLEASFAKGVLVL